MQHHLLTEQNRKFLARALEYKFHEQPWREFVVQKNADDIYVCETFAQKKLASKA